MIVSPGPSAIEAPRNNPRGDRGLTPLARPVPPQVRVAPRVGAKSARLSTVKTYAREVGMKKDGTSATVRPPSLPSRCRCRFPLPPPRPSASRPDTTDPTPSPRRDERRARAFRTIGVSIGV